MHRTSSPLFGYGMAALAVIIALLLWWPLSLVGGPEILYLLLAGAVTFAAWWDGLRAGLLALVLTAAAGGYFVARPHPFNPVVALWAGLPLYVLLGAGIVLLGEWLQRARRRTRLQAREVVHQREWLRAALQSIDEAVVAVDAHEKIALLNPTASLLTGWGAEEAHGKPLSEVVEFVHALSRNYLDSCATRALQTGSVAEQPENVLLRDREGTERRVAQRAVPMRDERGHIHGAVLFFHEYRDRAREREAAARAAPPGEAERCQEELLGALSHELHDAQAPLARGLEMLRQPAPDAAALDEARALLEHQIRRLARRVDDFLDVIHSARGRLQLQADRLDLVQLARAVVEEYRAALERAGRGVAVEASGTPVWIRGDARRLARILGALLEDETREARPGQVTVRVGLDPGRLRGVLTLHDTGRQLPPERLAHLFEPAPAGNHRRHPPCGTELPLVKHLVALHGGEVRAAAGPEGGVELTLQFPLEQEPTALTGEVSPHPSVVRLRVLVVEDNRDSADSMARLLEMMGHQVRIAYTGPEALLAAAEWRPQLVLCDIGLPGKDGYEVAQELRRWPATARVRLIAISGHGSDEDRRRALEAGFDHHLTKPVPPQVLQNVLALQTLVTHGEEETPAPAPTLAGTEKKLGERGASAP